MSDHVRVPRALLELLVGRLGAARAGLDSVTTPELRRHVLQVGCASIELSQLLAAPDIQPSTAKEVA